MRQRQGYGDSSKGGRGNTRNKLNDADGDEQDDLDGGENESEAITIGQSDSQEGSSDNKKEERNVNTNRCKPTYNRHSGNMIRSVKESWEDENLDDSSVNGEGRWRSQEYRNNNQGEDMDSGSEKTIHVSDSPSDIRDDTFEPATTDSEESIASVIKKKAAQKKQTTITNAFHMTKKEMDTMVLNNQNKPNNKEMNKRVTRSRGLQR